MRLEHNETKKGITDIIKSVRLISGNIASLNEQRANILRDDRYTEEYRSAALEKVNETFNGYFAAFAQALPEKLTYMAEIERELENALDITDTELLNSIQIIKALDGNTDTETTDKIISLFIGNMGALKLLKSVYDSCGVDNKAVANCIFSPADELEALAENTSTGAAESIKSGTLQIQTFCNDLIKIGEKLGLEFTDEEKETGINLDKYYEDMARSVMGLPVEEA